jgi:hypothetical protein
MPVQRIPQSQSWALGKLAQKPKKAFVHRRAAFLYVDVISTLAQQRFELPGACAL